MARFISTTLLAAVSLSILPAYSDDATGWIMDICDGIEAGAFMAGSAVETFGTPQECYGEADDDPEFGPYGEVSAIWPGITLTHRGLIPYPSGITRLEFSEPFAASSNWIARAKAELDDFDWETDLDPSSQLEAFADPSPGSNRFFRVEYDQDGQILAFEYSGLH